MFAIGTQEGLIILAVIALLFGARRLPELGKSLGQGIKEFRKASHSLTEDDEESPKGSSSANS
jgi:sec-independent protein translocase protein TatA